MIVQLGIYIRAQNRLPCVDSSCSLMSAGRPAGALTNDLMIGAIMFEFAEKAILVD
jgi:hypothetical protein